MIGTAIRRAANALLTAELVALVAFAALCFGGLPFGLATYGVMTGSMEPAIHVGDLAYVDTRVTGEDVSPGDVIAFDIGDGQTCTHRVVAVDEEAREITTKGDANGNPDAFPVAFERVKGADGRLGAAGGRRPAEHHREPRALDPRRRQRARADLRADLRPRGKSKEEIRPEREGRWNRSAR